MIHFTQPWGFLTLLSIPLILLLYSLRPKRVTLQVSTNKLWQEALRERQRGQGLQKLLRDVSLVLLLVFALLLSLAVSGVSWSTASPERNDIVLVLDVSASMQAKRSDGSSRFSEAKRQAEKIIASLDERARLLLMTSGKHPRLQSAFESDRSSLARTLAQIEATDETGSAKHALSLALSLLQSRETGKVHFITDRAFDGVGDLDTSRIQVHSIEGPSRNVAITRFDYRPETGTQERYQVLISVRNYTSDAITTTLSVELFDQLLLSKTLELDAHEDHTLVLPIEGHVTGESRAFIDVEDDLAEDNEAFAVIKSDEPLRVLLLTPGNVYLESALDALPNIVVTVANEVPASFKQQYWRYAVIVADRIEPPEMHPGNYLLIDVVPKGLPIVAGMQLGQSQVLGKSTGNMLQDIELGNLIIDRARKLEHVREAPGLHRLFWSLETDLAVALIENNLRMVVLAFNPSESNFPLQASFPLFLAESLAWLHPRSDRHGSTQVAAGDSVTLLTPDGETNVLVQTPKGQVQSYNSDGRGLPFRETSKAGIYRYDIGTSQHRFAVNLSNEQESDIRPRAAFAVTEQATADPDSSGQIEIPLWPTLVLLALVLLLLEWSLWCWRGANA